MTAEQQLLETAYGAFNARDMAAALAMMHPDVVWPNGMEGGYVHGHEEVRRYWTRQRTLIDPHVEPKCFACDDTGRTVVEVKQVVRDLAGVTLIDTVVFHAYLIENGLIRTMEIRDAG
jgi:ketosteroid isomerase-like protein